MVQKIVISASASLQEDIIFWKQRLEQMGFKVIDYPKPIVKNLNFPKNYKDVHTQFYRNIIETDILFVLNVNKNERKNYIGASVFAEITFAIGLNISQGKRIKIYCLNSIPKNLPYSDELYLWKKLRWIKLWDRHYRKNMPNY